MESILLTEFEGQKSSLDRTRSLWLYAANERLHLPMKALFCKWLLPVWGLVFLFSSSHAADITSLSTGSPESDRSWKDYYDIATQIPLEDEVPPPRAKPPLKLGAGAMVLTASNPYRGGDTVVQFLPMLTYVGERFFVVSPRAGFNLTRQSWGNVSVVADYRFKGEAFEAEGFLAGMDDRKDTVMAGLSSTLRTFGHYRMELSAMADVLDRHNGQDVNLALNRTFRLAKWALIPGAGLVWRSSDYNDYYYGVSASEATEARPAYDPGDSLEWFARLLLRYHLTDNWSLAGSARIEVLSDELRDSPIVDSDYLTTVFVGLSYTF